jgi:hypothetical protein
MESVMAQYSAIQKCRSDDVSIAVAHPAAGKRWIAASDLLHGTVIVGAVALMLATGGCGGSPPGASYRPDLTDVEMMALRGDPYARAALTPAQRQRVNADQASHPASAPSPPTWGRDTANFAMGAGAGYLLGSTTSGAQASATVTTGAATEEAEALAPEAAEVDETGAGVRDAAAVGEADAAVGESATAGEVATAGEAAEIGTAVGEAAEGAGLLETLVEGCIFVFCR